MTTAILSYGASDHMKRWIANHASELGAMLRAYRVKRRIPQKDVAKAASITAEHLCQIEAQNYLPHASTLTCIAAAYGMSLPSFIQVIWTEYQERCI